ncbi:aconitase X swivel domain-containing protein [Desulfurococcus mucosus]|uniref:Phosphomevalonate dehydratase small subunit-like domain-containing protein n=1 Tax=Desulfurococcus mucosus (strain ATCC 35584 / DSM 2162 / JCM 9187 / O7/1) TaxID=765177 RepID=E8R924_DESM0|nr:DUF126 domain-containing protein [Desulfurococcus mucosus]ADV65000.1 protein of unknown function DUF126 [Desulfurococcus mucosus DSM 2162]
MDQYLSFLGEVDPVRGVVKTESGEVSIRGRVLVFKGGRGSTVGSYVIYAMRQQGSSPLCMVVKEAEPILIAGCVIAEIPLLVVEDYEGFRDALKTKRRVRYMRGSGVIYAW